MDAQEILRNYFGYSSFRKGQSEIITAILEKRDVLGVMPTGAGKSICYQVPALMMSGITLVISPLISLMQDQVKALAEAGIRAAYINSALTEGQIVKALELAKQGAFKIMYIAPERLESSRFLDFALQANISMVTVDEAHCISQWGQDFRPSYLKVTEFVRQLPMRPILSAFTATATSHVKQDIIKLLELDEPMELTTGFDRENLSYWVQKRGGSGKDQYILGYIAAHSEESGIIYCATRKNVEKVYSLLKERYLPVAMYHAGMNNEDRKRNQDDFVFDRKSIMIATNAFGMGIDKSNVRYVIHYNMPSCMENYYQEAGRAGRDGIESECILLYSGQDIILQKFFLEKKEYQGVADIDIPKLKNEDYNRLRQMIDYSNTDTCLRSFILRYFGEKAGRYCDNCGNCSDEEPALAQPNFIKKHLESIKAATENLLAEEKQEQLEAVHDTVQAVEIEKPKKASSTGRKKKNNENEDLFDNLRQLRRMIASDKGVPPYIVFNDKTLKDMTARLPRNNQEFLQVDGVGNKKLEQYGDVFLSAIADYMKENNIAGPYYPNCEVEITPIEKVKKTADDYIRQGKIMAVKELLNAGLLDLRELWQSGLYTAEELDEIQK